MWSTDVVGAPVRGGVSLDDLPPMAGNPYLEAYRRSGSNPWTGPSRDELRAIYGFAIPDDRALAVVAAHAPRGVVEIGAGTGYWARLLHDRGVDVVAYDVAPPPSPENAWFAGQQPWFPVEAGDEQDVARFPERTLLLVWPTRNEDWAGDAAELHLQRGGQRLAYVGEPPGGRTGDPRLHALLDLVGRCLACAYGVTSVPCTCGVTRRWRLLQQVSLPRWDDRDDHLYVFGPPAAAPTARRLTRLARRPAWSLTRSSETDLGQARTSTARDR